ncbi:hypothetical protein ACHAPJ_012699 [Fusarium lateritium]
MGLHMNIGDAYLPDPELKEHRIRLWWSVYILDRFLSSKIGLPLSISDADISVDLPSTSSALSLEDFGDHSRFVAIIHLARVAGNISRSLYVRTPQRGTFLQRVTKIREELDHWRLELPDHLKFDLDGSGEGNRFDRTNSSTLELSFNQLMILATRPVLLFLFRRHRDRCATASTGNSLPDQAQDVADICIRSARQSCQLLLQFWANGNFPIFDYSYVRYLFSAATILAISSTLDREDAQSDKGKFDLATGFLQQLEQNGNPAAMEFYSHIKETQSILETQRPLNSAPDALPIEDSRLPRPTEPIQSLLSAQHLAATDSSSISLHAADDSPLNLSFLDDWLYDNALTQLCWQEE